MNSIITPARREAMQQAAQAQNRDQRRAAVARGLLDREGADTEPDSREDADDLDSSITRDGVLT